MGERNRTNSAEMAPELSPEMRASPELDPAIRHQAFGRDDVPAAQREERVQELAPKIGKTALTAKRREEVQKAVGRQLVRKALGRERHQDRD